MYNLPQPEYTEYNFTGLVSLTDVGQHLVEHLVGLGVVGDVLEADDIPEALTVLSEDLLTGRLVEELCWQLLSIDNLEHSFRTLFHKKTHKKQK